MRHYWKINTVNSDISDTKLDLHVFETVDSSVLMRRLVEGGEMKYFLHWEEHLPIHWTPSAELLSKKLKRRPGRYSEFQTVVMIIMVYDPNNNQGDNKDVEREQKN